MTNPGELKKQPSPSINVQSQDPGPSPVDEEHLDESNNEEISEVQTSISHSSEPIPEVEIEDPSNASNDDNTGMDHLMTKMEKLSTAFEQKIRYDQHKDEMINKLHSELQGYKEDLVLQLLRPVITDIVLIIENHKRWVQGLYQRHEAGSLEIEKLLQQIKELPAEWSEVLNRQAVESFTSELDASFNGKTQKVLKTIAIDDATKDRTIARLISPGYRWRDKILRQEQVEVFKYNSKNHE